MTQPPADFSLTATIREVERHWLARLPAGSLMERAAAAVASQADRIARFRPRGGTIIALVGPGNNGGDALLALTALRDRGYPVEALALAPEHMPAAADAARARARWSASGATLEALSMLESSLSGAALVIDGLFGIGLSRGLDGNAAKAATLLAGASGTPVLAVDVPSGIDADTGAIVGGRGHVAVRADLTVTMIADKPGLATGDGLAHAGRSVLASLGLPAAPVDGRRIDRAHVAGWMPARARNAHKGSHGTVSVVGGAEGMRGAALLAARAAQCAGAGKVIVTGPDGPSFDPGQPQLMSAEPAPALAAASAIAIGCGLGQGPQALELLCQCLARPVPLVADADALNLIAGDTGTAALTALRARSAQTPTVLTPHPLEAARLLDTDAASVQADRIGAACALSRSLSGVVVLKGAGTVIATPQGAWGIVDTGGPALGVGGTGDVLAGALAALLAQGLDGWHAAALAAWAHGEAGDRWSIAHSKGIGLSSTDLPALITESLNAQ